MLNIDSLSLGHDTSALTQALKACGDPLRLKILQVMKNETFGVLELTQLFDTKQSGMSHHLKILNQANLVEAQREGNSIFYRRPIKFEREIDKALAKHLFDLIDQFALDTQTLEGIEQIRVQRAQQSQLFFAKNSNRFSEQQELIASHDLYAPSSMQVLNQTLQDVGKRVKVALEIGPGEGLLLKDLSAKFDQVIALDNSADMLKKARQTCEKEALSNVDLILGDTSDFLEDCLKHGKSKVDLVMINMVLHHVPTPSKIFTDIKGFLTDRGIVVVCDLCKHNQEWTKASCGDLWCGFDTEELNQWADKAGLKQHKEVYIGLRNGFQLQVKSFINLTQS